MDDKIIHYAGSTMGYAVSDEIECSNCGKIYSENIRICECCGADIVAAPSLEVKKHGAGFPVANIDVVNKLIPSSEELQAAGMTRVLYSIQEERCSKLLAEKQKRLDKEQKKYRRRQAKLERKAVKRKEKLERKRRKRELKVAKRRARRPELPSDVLKYEELVDSMKVNNTYIASKEDKFEIVEPKTGTRSTGHWVNDTIKTGYRGTCLSRESYVALTSGKVPSVWNLDKKNKDKGYKNVSRVVRN